MKEAIEADKRAFLLYPAGKLAGRTSDDGITVLKTVGYAVLDIAAAYQVYKNALERGIGAEIAP
jgi:ornithine cyclodeaminase